MNSNPAYKNFEYFLKIIQKQKKDRIHHLLKGANKKVIKAIIEIAYNLLKGDIPLSNIQIRKLKCDKNKIQYLVNKKHSLENKRKVLYENPELVRHMLRIVL